LWITRFPWGILWRIVTLCSIRRFGFRWFIVRLFVCPVDFLILPNFISKRFSTLGGFVLGIDQTFGVDAPFCLPPNTFLNPKNSFDFFKVLLMTLTVVATAIASGFALD